MQSFQVSLIVFTSRRSRQTPSVRLGPSDTVEITAQKETSSFIVSVLVIFSGLIILSYVILVVKRRQNGLSQNSGQYQLLPVAN